MNNSDQAEIIEAETVGHETGHALIVEQPKPIQIRNAFDIAPGEFKKGLQRRGKNRAALMEWLRAELKEGVDWGRIHVVKKDKCPEPWNCTNKYHYSKPSLWKSGAEKLAGMMGLRSTWPGIDAEVEQIRQRENRQDAIIMLKCQLLDQNGSIVSEGIGARGISQDGGDINKALKMAKKSSLIDATLNAGGLSEVFTQDVEDMPPGTVGEHADPYQRGEDRVDNAFPNSNQHPVATHCPIGQNKGKPWTEQDEGFLNWIVEKIDDKPDIVAAARKELESRHLQTDESAERQANAALDTTGKTLADYAREITRATHIDQITVIRDELPAEHEPALRLFMTKRERELMGSETNL